MNKRLLLPFKFGLSVQVVFVVFFAFFLGEYVPLKLQSFFYACSITLKEILFFALPFIIFSYLFSSILQLGKGVVSFVICLLVCVCASNFCSTMISYGISSYLLKGATIKIACPLCPSTLIPLWSLSLPRLIPNEYALFSGFLLSIFFVYYPSKFGDTLSTALQKGVSFFLTKGFIPLVPLFILGFALKLQHDGVLQQISETYGPILAVIAIVQCLYTTFLYGLASHFSLKKWGGFIKNMLPAMLTGFSSMSSAAAMPLTLKGADENTNHNPLVKVIIPTTVNIHLIGDSLGIPSMAIAILMTFGHPFPEFSMYLNFAFYFVLVKFAVAAVPGGGILVMIPILEKHLHFSPEMSGLITALYLLFDPINTSMNVFGNGAFAILFSKLLSKGKRLISSRS
jgi:Na+/H+-dicarboxylate symporter